MRNPYYPGASSLGFYAERDRRQMKAERERMDDPGSASGDWNRSAEMIQTRKSAMDSYLGDIEAEASVFDKPKFALARTIINETIAVWAPKFENLDECRAFYFENRSLTPRAIALFREVIEYTLSGKRAKLQKPWPLEE